MLQIPSRKVSERQQVLVVVMIVAMFSFSNEIFIEQLLCICHCTRH